MAEVGSRSWGPRPKATQPACDPAAPNSGSGYRLTSLAVLLLAAPLAAQTGTAPSWQDALARYVAPYSLMNDFSGTILILGAGHDSVIGAFGYADRIRGIRNGPETRFGIGSLTKTFTAAAVVMLQKRGLLSFQDTLGKFIPGFPHGADITIEQLLAHEAGIPDYHALPDYPGQRARPVTLAAFAKWIASKPLDFRPGTNSAYSSSGYALLAYVIERVSGTPYAVFLHHNIFEPLGMTATGDLNEGGVVRGLAIGYDPGFPPTGVQAPPAMSATWLAGSGSLYSTVSDLARWARAVRDDRLFTLQGLPYPYGWGKRTWLGRDAIEQDGRIALGYASHLSIYPKDSVIVIILSNIQSAVTDRMRTDLAALAFGEPYQMPELRPAATPEPALLEQYAGRYQVGPSFVMTVRAAGPRLTLAGPEGDFLPLEPEDDTTFFFRTLYVAVRFERNSAGKVAALNWGGQVTCQKIE